MFCSFFFYAEELSDFLVGSVFFPWVVQGIVYPECICVSEALTKMSSCRFAAGSLFSLLRVYSPAFNVLPPFTQPSPPAASALFSPSLPPSLRYKCFLPLPSFFSPPICCRTRCPPGSARSPGSGPTPVELGPI